LIACHKSAIACLGLLNASTITFPTAENLSVNTATAAPNPAITLSSLSAPSCVLLKYLIKLTIAISNAPIPVAKIALFITANAALEAPPNLVAPADILGNILFMPPSFPITPPVNPSSTFVAPATFAPTIKFKFAIVLFLKFYCVCSVFV